MGVTEVFGLPVGQMAMLEYEEVWSKQFDPQADGFINTKDLDAFLVTLAEQKHASDLFIVPEWIKESEKYREQVIATLEIPTFAKLQKVMFYDVIQSLVTRKVKQTLRKDTLIESKMKV